MRVFHYGTELDLTILVEKTRDVNLNQAGMNTRDKKVRARIASICLALVVVAVARRRPAEIAVSMEKRTRRRDS